MAVVKMNKIAVMGLTQERSALLESLMELGVVEIKQEEVSEYLQDKAHNPNVQTELLKIDSILADLSRSIDIIKRYMPEKKPMFYARRIVSEADYSSIMKHRDEALNYASQINRYEDEITSLKGDGNRLIATISSLNPWLELDIPLDITTTRHTFCTIGSLSSRTDLKEFEEALNKEYPEVILLKGTSDRDHHFTAIIAHQADEAEVTALLRNWGWNRITLRDIEGTAKDSKKRLERKIAALQAEREEKIEAIKVLASKREHLEVVSDGFRMEHARIEVKSRLISTRSVFLLKGWLPAGLSAKVKEFLDKHFFCSVEIDEPEKDEEFPVLLKNGPIVESISPIINMYGVPSSKEIDPSAVTMPFYIFFFGLMLGDGGYGIIIALVTGFILKKFRLEDSTRRFMKLLFFCGLSTIVAGFLFGSWFGIASLTKTALWIVPTEEPELMMSYTILIGIIHMYTGLFMKALNLIRRGQILDAIFDVFFVYIMLTGFVLSLLSYAPGLDTSNLGGLVKIGNYLFIVGVGLLLLTQGRKSKNIFGKIFGGLPKLYDVVAFFSDCLSYTRILALGLASSIIGDIVNTLSTSFGGNIIIRVIATGFIIIIGHSLNFALNALGAYVHSCRLQFLEFFGKFLEGGGEAFKPFKANTQYIIVQTNVSQFINSGIKSRIV